MRRFLIIGCCMAAALVAGCGGSAKTLSGGGSTGTGTGGGTATVLSMGNGSGSSFQSGIIAVSTATLSAGGSTSLQVTIVDQKGALYTTSTTITFNSPCVGQGLASITAAGAQPGIATLTTSNGTANATYSAAGCSGGDVITASASANGQTLSASNTVTVAQAAIGSIAFVSATPPNITLKGVGSSSGSATSTVIFKVLDTSGGPRAGATVTFSLNTTVGGITIAPTSAVTDASGQVQTIVSAGTVATTIRVTAITQTAAGASISTQSNALTVSTGIPTSHNISLAVGSTGVAGSTQACPNIEAWTITNQTLPVLVTMTDRFNNPVPNGTTANFRTTLGGISPSCQTAGGLGQCTVTWNSVAGDSVSGNPQSTTGDPNAAAAAYCSSAAAAIPGLSNLCNSTTNGRSPILVTAIGEESFKDANGNGVFDPADIVAFDATNADNNFANGTPKPWQDTSEPFLNQWELYDAYGTPTFVSGEPFIDFNNSGTRDGPDNLFNGSLCEGSLCNTTQTSVAVGASNVIVMSGSTAYYSVLSPAAPPYHFAGGLDLQVAIYDEHLQQMPGGTTVTPKVLAGTTAQIVSTLPAAWPCSTAPPYVNGSNQVVAGQVFEFLINPTTTTPQAAGTLSIAVQVPSGLITTFNIPIQP